MLTFYKLLGNALIVITKNNFVWFALTYWLYLQTQSVVSTAVLGGIFMIFSSISNIGLGSIVDHYPKKWGLVGSSIVTLTFFALAFAFYNLTPVEYFTTVNSWSLWIFVLLLLCGTTAGNIYSIAIPTLVTVLVPEDDRDKANGLFGSIMGVSFSITSVASGLALGYSNMQMVLVIAIVLTLLALFHILTIEIREKKVKPEPLHEDEHETQKADIWKTIKAITSIPGLLALILFTTLNNFIGGVFMALMDAYGLTLVSVQVWGLLWGVLSMGFILGGLIIAKKGLGENPLKTLFRINIVTWTVSIFFTIQPSIVLLAAGILFWITLMPFIEATEQTIIQKVVPPARQGRVFGFAHSVEQAASPITAFFIGPITQFIFIPFMTTGAGVGLIGNWYGVGPGRGMALVFSLAGVIGLCITLIAMRSNAYKLLYERYKA